MPKKILLLISDTGGGHRASADAISEAMAHLYGNAVSLRIVDAWKNHFPWPINQIPGTYSWLVSDGRWLWDAFWRNDVQAWSPKLLSELVTPFVQRTLAEMFRAETPDMVVAVHPILNQTGLRVVRNVLHSDVPFVTVVTDLVTAHPSWFCPRVDYCMVPTEGARLRALRYGMPGDRVEVVGQPVGLKFAAGVGEKLYLRGKLGLHLERPAVLIVGGGEGMGPVYETARAIATDVPNAQLIVVAGRNDELKHMLEATDWEIPTQIHGFVQNMPELMGASDVLVTKAGPGQLSEAFIAGLPIIMSSFIPGQEEGNIRYVLEHQAGVYLPDPMQIASLIRQWLQSDNDTLNQMARNAAALARPDAALTIARRVHHFLTHRAVNRPISPRRGRRRPHAKSSRLLRLRLPSSQDGVSSSLFHKRLFPKKTYFKSGTQLGRARAPRPLPEDRERRREEEEVV